MEERIASLAASVVRAYSEAGITCGCAESCTGGLVSGAITSVAGSSAVLRGGIVSYHPEIKRLVLGVDSSVIDDPEIGVVSGPCAAQMALGARRVLSSDVAVSVTGIAGPGGAEPGKPVGTVWFGIASDGGVSCERHLFVGTREAVRQQAVLRALELLFEAAAKG